VGGYFGGMLARAGAPVAMIGRPAFVERVNRSGLFLDTTSFQESVKVEASTEMQAAADADIVLFCVKSTDTVAAATELAGVIRRDAVVVCLQNGVDNADKVRAASGINALPAVVYIACTMEEPGRIKHNGRGDLVLGLDDEQTRRVAALFERAGVPCRISDNMRGELWAKLLWNCALNAISAVGRVRYGRIAENSEARTMVEDVAREFLAVARAERVVLPGVPDHEAGLAGAMKIATQMSAAFSSTAQDLFRGKRTEIDSLNGYIVQRGRELGVPTPVNHALWTLVKLAETGQAGAVA